MPAEPTGCASCTDCQCGKNERNQEDIDDNRLIKHQRPESHPLNRIEKRQIYRRELMSRPPMTESEIDARILELRARPPSWSGGRMTSRLPPP
jgi:hypothetical protein